MNGRAGRGPRTAGFTLIEIIVTGVMVVATITLLAQALMHVAANRLMVERRALALHEVGNLMERLAAADWAAGTPDWAARPEISDEARRRIPGATLAVAVSTPTEEPGARRVEVTLRSGETDPGMARLVSWVYPRKARP